MSAERIFLLLCDRSGIPAPATEHRFDAVRKWRFDYAWPRNRVALEVEGGAWTRGRHTRGAGFIADLEKYSEAAAQGWRVLRVTPSTLCTEATVKLVRRALEFRAFTTSLNLALPAPSLATGKRRKAA